ncbi:hypothetical protein [Streptosporangium sp. NPDC006007]|uniref:hypothetical protein n=1 Tax=Streptosporangium sp. NPDC006007 TaxID=3154575 RepID=UPI0033B49EC5
MHAPTRAPQIELGVPEPSGTFGPVTLDTLSQRFPVVYEDIRRANIIRIVRSGLHRNGYRGGELGGAYDSVTAAVAEPKADMGVSGVFTADGVAPFGVGASGSTRRFVRLFQAAMIFNGRSVPFDGPHTPAVGGTVTDFQRFARLEARRRRGAGDGEAPEDRDVL